VRGLGSIGYEERMAEVHGLRPATGNPGWPCPRVAAGKRCLRGYPSSRHAPCVCEALYPDPLDHGRVWLDAGGRYVVTAEPYGHPDLTGSLDRLNDVVGALGLVAEVRPDEQWAPGQTVLVWIQGVRSPRARSSLT
jgi:hypothetical protein